MSKPINNKPGKGQQPRPGNAAQASRKRSREPKEKMQPSLRRQNPAFEKLDFAGKLVTEPFGDKTFDLMIARLSNGGKLVTNVNQVIIYRSQHGFDVGHEGTPVRDFALNILHRLLCDPTDPTVCVNGIFVTRAAWYAHEAFARDVLAKIDMMPGQYQTIPEHMLRLWCERNRWRWTNVSGAGVTTTGSEA